MFGMSPQSILKLALSIYPPEKIKGVISEHFDTVLDGIIKKASEDVVLTEKEKQIACMIFHEHDAETNKPGLFVLLVVLDHDLNISRKVKAWNIRQTLLNMDLEAIIKQAMEKTDETKTIAE